MNGNLRSKFSVPALALLVALLLVVMAAPFARADDGATAAPAVPAPVNITAQTGQQVVGEVISWQTTDGGQPVEQLAGLNPKNNLLVFWQRGAEPWQVVNVSAVTGRKVVGPVTHWQKGNVTYLAGRGLRDELLLFSWAPGRDWQADNLSQQTNERITSSLVDWQEPFLFGTTIEFLAGRGRGGDLLVFAHLGDSWQVVNVTRLTGQPISGPVTHWQVTHFLDPAPTTHLAARGRGGDLLVFSLPEGGNWQVENVSQHTNQRIAGPVAVRAPEPSGGIIPQVTGTLLAARGEDGGLLIFEHVDLLDAWFAYDLMDIAGGRATAGEPMIYNGLDHDGNDVLMIGVRDRTDSLILYWLRANRGWQQVDMTAITRVRIGRDPHGYLANGAERIAVVDRDKNLLLFRDHTQPRLLTDDLTEPVFSLEPSFGSRKVVAVLWDAGWPEQPPQRHPPEAIRDTLFGPGRSVRSLFLENSAGQFTVEDAGVLGWYESDKGWEHYWNESCAADPIDADGDGWLDGHVEKRTEAIRKADPDIDFSQFDRDRDGVLERDEVAITVVFPSTGASGFHRAVVGRQYPPANGQCPSSPESLPHDPLIVDGVEVTEAIEFYTGTGPSFSVPAHELSHILLGALDMYGFCIQNFTICGHSSAPGIYSLMDESHSGTHIDPFHKLKWGWLRPRIIFRDGVYELRSTPGRNDAWVLMDPARGTDEYFIVENRRRDPDSFDAPLPDDGGLAVWHVMEDPAVFNTAPPPPLTDPAMWAALQGDTGRRAVRLIRPVWSLPINDALGLWDGAQPGADHDLLSSDPDPLRGQLRWADGTPSGFALRDISAAGPVMTARIEVP